MSQICDHENTIAKGSRFEIRIVCEDCGYVLKGVDRRDPDSGVPSDLQVDSKGRLPCGEMSTAPEDFKG